MGAGAERDQRLILVDRRTLLAALPALTIWPVRAQGTPPALAAYEGATGGRIGLHAENLVTGAKVAWRADERFAMCSTFKASLAAFTLARIDRGRDRLDAMVPYGPADLLDYAPVAKRDLAHGAMSVEAMCEGAVELSDNTCANLLLARAGGPAALTAFWRETGDAITRLDHDEPVLNRSAPGELVDTTTPAAMAGTLRRLMLGDVLTQRSRARLTSWMVACKTGGNRLRAGLPRGWRVADKTGNNGGDASSDIAIAWVEPDTPIVICAYTQGGTPTAPRLAAVFEDIGRMVAARLVG